jgi:hypothetical protein
MTSANSTDTPAAGNVARMTGANLRGTLVGGALVALLACSSSSSSGGGETCDNGGGGLTAAMCASYAARGSCSSNKFTTTAGHPCTQYPNETITTDCCYVSGCTGSAELPDSTSFPAGPACGPQDGGSGE